MITGINTASQLVWRYSETGSSGVFLDICAQSFSFVREAKLVSIGCAMNTNIPNDATLVNRLPGVVKYMT